MYHVYIFISLSYLFVTRSDIYNWNHLNNYHLLDIIVVHKFSGELIPTQIDKISFFSTMASGTRSKVASLSSSISLSDAQDISESLDHDSRRHISPGDRPSIQKKSKQPAFYQFFRWPFICYSSEQLWSTLSCSSFNLEPTNWNLSKWSSFINPCQFPFCHWYRSVVRQIP